MTRRDQIVAAGITALEDQLAVCADLQTAARNTDHFANERDRVTALSGLERERREIANALRVLKTHAVTGRSYVV